MKCEDTKELKGKSATAFLPYEQVYVIKDNSPPLALEARALVDTRFFIHYGTYDRRRALAIRSKMDERMCRYVMARRKHVTRILFA